MSYKIDDLIESIKALNGDEKKELIEALVNNIHLPICDADELYEARKSLIEARQVIIDSKNQKALESQNILKKLNDFDNFMQSEIDGFSKTAEEAYLQNDIERQKHCIKQCQIHKKIAQQFLDILFEIEDILEVQPCLTAQRPN